MDKTTAFIVPAGTMKEDGTWFTHDTFVDRSTDLRDWFAGMALMGIASQPDYHNDRFDAVADHCYKQADAMLAQRGEG